jgi:hypothetical protein
VWPLNQNLHLVVLLLLASRNIEPMSARIANLFYWAACTAAVLWAAFILVATATVTHPDWSISTPIALIGAVVIWTLGLIARYALSGR